MDNVKSPATKAIVSCPNPLICPRCGTHEAVVYQQLVIEQSKPHSEPKMVDGKWVITFSGIGQWVHEADEGECFSCQTCFHDWEPEWSKFELDWR